MMCLCDKFFVTKSHLVPLMQDKHAGKQTSPLHVHVLPPYAATAYLAY